MAALLTAFKDALFFKDEKLVIDSWVFQMFNTVTSPAMVLASVIVSSRQFFGEPIKCDPGTVKKEGDTWQARGQSSL